MANRLNLGDLTKKLRKNQTPWETKLWYYLRAGRFKGLKFKRQVPIGKYIADFCCQEKKLVIELDGGQHDNKEIREDDLQKDRYLTNKGYKVLRLWNNEVDDNIEGVLEVVRKSVK